MQEEKGIASEDGAINPYAHFQLPLPRETSRFSTTFSFYEFIDQELKEEEERDMLILKVRENIIGSLVEELYNRYIDRQVIPFTVKCFLQSVRRILNWYFLPRDREDTAIDWEKDESLPQVPVDNWASYCIPSGSYPPKVEFKFESLTDEGNGKMDDELIQTDFPDFYVEDHVNGDEFSWKWESNESKSSLQNTLSESELAVNEDYLGDDWMSPTNEEFLSPSKVSPKLRKTHFLVPSIQKIKREINQWISPKNFPPVRVSAGMNILPGEKISGKTCGRKVPIKHIAIRPAKPTFINSRGQEIRSFSF